MRRSGAGGFFTRDFFARSSLEVAPELIGAWLVHRLPDGTHLAGRIVEVEAYLGDGSDPASHAHRGPTPRNRAMFGPPGHLYVYRSYGIHVCANVVCDAEGRASALLLRAAEPTLGGRRLRRNRGLPADAPDRSVASGPGRLGQAFALELRDDGRSLLRGALTLRRPPAGQAPPRLATSPRIGIRWAADLPYRFFDRDSACVSPLRGRPLTRAALRRAGPPPTGG